MTGSGGAGWRVFVSHTSELREFPAGGSYVAAVERAVSACGHVVVNMADFPAVDQLSAELCRDRVRGCDVFLGVLGTRYGSPVRDQPQVSYTELEFDAATEAGLARLVFVLDTGAADVGIPVSRLMDLEFGVRQEAFRSRIQAAVVTQEFADPGTLGQLVERSLRDLASRRQHSTERPRQQVSPLVVAGEIPQEPLGFQARPDLLAALDAPALGAGVRVVSALTGMRGVGKTHLAAAYARAKVAQRWRLVAWVNAEDHGLMLAGLAEVAATLGLGSGSEDAVAAGRAVRHWLETDGERCLLVFDNAVDPRVLREFIPAAGAARVIITSNHQSMAALGAVVPVEVFSKAEALTFLAARTGHSDVTGAQEVAKEVGWLPLALAQAAAVIAAQRLSYDTYLERLQGLPADDLLAAEEGGQYPQGVAAAVLLSLDSVRSGADGAACGAVMDVLAVLSAAGVRRSVIHTAASQDLLRPGGSLAGVDAVVADRVLGRLAGVSLLTFSMDGSVVAAHRLVMRVIRENIAAAGSLTAVCQAAERLLSGLAESLRDCWHQDRAAVRDLVEQIVAVAESADLCPPGGALEPDIIRLRWWAVWFLNRLGDSAAQAVVLGERVLADQERVLGPDDPNTLTLQHDLANAYREAGRIGEAITMHEHTLAAMERVLDRNHLGTLAVQNSLAVDYWAAGRIGEAITMHEQTLAAMERVLGRDHPDILAVQNNLAADYWAAGRIAGVISMDERTLAARERVLGPDHPDTLKSRNYLANGYRAAGRIGEAITIGEQTLTVMERVLGPDHPDTLKSRNNLANAYRAAGRSGEAITMHEQTLAALGRVLGPDHPDALQSRNNLANAYQAADRSGEAITMHEQTLAARKRVLGPDHRDTLQSRNNLDIVYRAVGGTSEPGDLNPSSSDL